MSSTKRRCRGCIGREQTAAKRDGRPKKRLDGHGVFRCEHFLRLILALAEIRCGTRGNFEHEAACRDLEDRSCSWYGRLTARRPPSTSARYASVRKVARPDTGTRSSCCRAIKTRATKRSIVFLLAKARPFDHGVFSLLSALSIVASACLRFGTTVRDPGLGGGACHRHRFCPGGRRRYYAGGKSAAINASEKCQEAT